MNRHPEGKGVFIWQIAQCQGGNVVKIADTLREDGYSWVAVKIADGPYNVNNELQLDSLVAELRRVVLGVWGWHYIYGYYPLLEANAGLEHINKFNLDGYILDPEGEYKQAGKATAAKKFMKAVRLGTDVPIGLCSYRYPTYHAELPWQEFLPQCDFHAPQVYWEGAHNPGAQLIRSMTELKGLKDIPFCPVGSAYHVGGWEPTVSDINEFYTTAVNQGCVGNSWWVWDAPMGLGGHPEFKTEIAKHTWGVSLPPPLPKPTITITNLDSYKVPVLKVPYYSQLGIGADEHHNDCGAACGSMLVEAFTGRVVSVDTFYNQTGTSGDAYLSAQNIIDVMGRYGVTSSWKILDFADLYKSVIEKKPVITLIKYAPIRDAGLSESNFGGPHFLIVLGMDIENIYVHDPLWPGEGGKNLAIPISIFMDAWNLVGTDPVVPNPSYGAIVPVEDKNSASQMFLPIVGS